MKKFLLLLGLSAIAAPAFAGVETTKYEDINGLTCTNLFNISRLQDVTEWNDTPAAEFNNKTRSMVGHNDNIVIAHSRTMVVGEESNDYAHLLVYNRYSGEFVKQVQITVGGEPLSGLLCANQIGCDDFGNYWLIGLTGSTEKSPIVIYHIKDLDTGEAEVAASLTVDPSESDAFGRHDYYDLVGDVTGKQCGTVMMTPVASGSQCFVVGFAREQGSDTWGPHMGGGEYYSQAMEETYPAEQTTWNGAPQIRIIRDEEHSGDLFYIDAFVTAPALYNTEGAMLDSFGACPELAPAVGPNGVAEFHMGDEDFLVYTNCDYDGKTAGSQVAVARLGEGQAFEGMTKYWELPQIGLGNISDTGSRMFGISPQVMADKNGKEGCYLTIYKCNNGLATYRLAAADYVDPVELGVKDIVADFDESAPVRYYNMQGIELTEPAAGTLVIRRQGSTSTKMLVK